MFASVRRYVLEPWLADAVSARAGDVGRLLAELPGCTGGHLIRTRDGLIVVLLGDDERAAAYAGTRFAAWAHRRVPDLRDAPQPEVWAGDVVGAAPGAARPRAGPREEGSRRRHRM